MPGLGRDRPRVSPVVAIAGRWQWDWLYHGV